MPFRSLRLQLVIPYVALLLGLAATIGLLSYFAGSRAIESVADRLLVETVERIRLAVDRHLVGSRAVLEAAFPSGVPAGASVERELEALRMRFWVATTIHFDPNRYVYYGNRAGQSVGLYRRSADAAEWRLKLRPDELRARFALDGIDAAPRFESREDRPFDPRERPWYRAAAVARGPVWTPVYVDFASGDLVATLARPVPAPDGSVEGVVATDVPLRALDEFVHNLRVSPRGLAYLLEPDGHLIAASSAASTERRPDGSSARRSASAGGDAVLARIHARLGSEDALDGARLVVDGPDGEPFYVAAKRVRDDAGMDWLTVVAIPRGDLMDGVTRNVASTAAISLVAALLALSLGLAIVNRVARDVRRLSETARSLDAPGRAPSPPALERRDELGAIARSLETLHERLATDPLTGLANRDAFVGLLEDEMARVRSRRAEGEDAGCSVLFIDLDGFKRLNDRLGHAAGDRALVEVAARLRTSVRGGDHVGRYAGDEFILLLRDIADPATAKAVRRHVEVNLERPYRAEGAEGPSIDLRGTIGTAIYPLDAVADAAALVHLADERMYAAKPARSRAPGVSFRAAT